MINKIIATILNLFLKIYDKQDRYISSENWFNPGDLEELKISLNPDPSELPEKPAHPKNVQFCSPVVDNHPFVTSHYGYRILHKGAKRRFHCGTDLRARQNTTARVVEEGIVTRLTYLNPSAPNAFKIINGRYVRQKNGYITPMIEYRGVYTGNLYQHKHCEPDKQIKKGDTVQLGSRIGHYGDYGLSIGSHCHFELYIYKPKSKTKYKRVNPRVWLKKRAGIKSVGRTRSIAVTTYENYDVGN